MSDGDKCYREKAGKEDWELLEKVVQFYIDCKGKPHSKGNIWIRTCGGEGKEKYSSWNFFLVGSASEGGGGGKSKCKALGLGWGGRGDPWEEQWEGGQCGSSRTSEGKGRKQWDQNSTRALIFIYWIFHLVAKSHAILSRGGTLKPVGSRRKRTEWQKHRKARLVALGSSSARSVSRGRWNEPFLFCWEFWFHPSQLTRCGSVLMVQAGYTIFIQRTSLRNPKSSSYPIYLPGKNCGRDDFGRDDFGRRVLPWLQVDSGISRPSSLRSAPSTFWKGGATRAAVTSFSPPAGSHVCLAVQ